MICLLLVRWSEIAAARWPDHVRIILFSVRDLLRTLPLTPHFARELYSCKSSAVLTLLGKFTSSYLWRSWCCSARLSSSFSRYSSLASNLCRIFCSRLPRKDTLNMLPTLQFLCAVSAILGSGWSWIVRGSILGYVAYKDTHKDMLSDMMDVNRRSRHLFWTYLFIIFRETTYG